MRIVFTGGGTAGHVMPNIALIKCLLKDKWEVFYIGSKNGMEKDLIEAIPGVTYYGISGGKLRRYLSAKNLSDPIRVQHGYHEAFSLIGKIKPDIVFSKGGYVSLPVVAAAKNHNLIVGSKKVKIISHESDYTPGLANKLAMPYCDTICVTFEDTANMIKNKHVVCTGTPIRDEIIKGSREKGLKFTGLYGEKPIILVMGGSSGAQHMNELVRSTLDTLLKKYDVVHLCGKGKVDDTFKYNGYVQYEYISKELPDLFAIADVVISRAGANAVFELMSLKKPSVLIPLPLSASRGDQILNAKYFNKRGMAEIVDQDTATSLELIEIVNKVYRDSQKYIDAISKDSSMDGTKMVLNVIKESVKDIDK